MSLIVEWSGLADAAVNDSRGNLSLIGFSPQAIVAESFPEQLSCNFVVILDDDEDPEPILTVGRSVTFRIELNGPDGEVLFYGSTVQRVEPKSLLVLPTRLQVVAHISFNASKAGIYRVGIRATIDGSAEESISAVRRFRVMDNASLAKPSSEINGTPALE